MMNKTVEAIKDGQKVTMEEAFELVNVFNITSLSVHEFENTIFKMQVNHFESYEDVFEFSQEYTDDNMYKVKQSDILLMDARYDEEFDSLVVKCQMPGNGRLDLVIYYVSKDFKVSCLEEYYEIDLESTKDFLENTLGEEAEYKCASVSIEDKFCMSLKMIYPERTYIDTDDSDCKLHVSDNINVLEVSVMDDACNAFYRKDTDSSVEIVVKPYGQAFMEVRMLFFK